MDRTNGLTLEVMPCGALVAATKARVYAQGPRAIFGVLLSCVLALGTGCGFHLNNPNSNALSLTPTNQNFGSVLIGDTAKQTFTLVNQYFLPIAITSVSTTTKDFVATSNCPISPATLAPTKSCTVTVQFSPTAAGDHSGAVNVAYSASDVPATALVTGTGMVAPPGVSVSPTSLTFSNVTVGQTSAAQNVTLTNLVSGPLTISSITADAPFAVTSTTCPLSPATLAGGATCTVAVTFKPSSAGASSGNLTIVDSDSTSPQKVSLSGTAVAPVVGLAFAPTSLTFASTTVGSTSPSQAAVLTNTGSVSLALSSLAASTDFLETNNCPASLPAKGSCTVNVQFSPGTAGTKTGAVTVTYPSGSQQLMLTGTAVAPIVGLAFAPTSLTFASTTVGSTSPSQAAVLTNTGSASLTLNSIAASTDFLETNNCPASLPAMGSCTVNVQFSPATAGSKTGTVTVIYPSGSQQLILSGTAVAPIVGVSFSPTSLTFASTTVGGTSPGQFTVLTNKGSAPLVLSSILASADFTQTNDCPATLPAKSSCSINVKFAPTTAGSITGSVAVTYPSGSQQLMLTGTAVAPIVGLSFAPTSLTFASTTVGTTSPSQAAVLTNTGSTSLTLSSIAASTDFLQTNNCPASLPAKGTCTVTVQFSPGTVGAKTGSVTITYPSGSHQLSLTGTAVAPIIGVSFSPASLTFVSTTVGSTSPGQFTVLTNKGSAPLVLNSILASADFTQTNDCPATLPAKSSCSINVKFAPTTAGTITGTVTVTYPSGSQQLMLSGTATAPVVGVTFAPTSLSFASTPVGDTSPTQAAVLTNIGSAPLTLNSISASADFLETNNCPASLPAKGSCTVNVQFSPEAMGSKTGAVTVTYPSGSQQLMLSGTAIAPIVGVSFAPTSLTFVSTPVGSSSPSQAVVLTNIGSSSLTLNSITASTDFVQTNDCPATLPAKGSCTVNVQFSPATAGSKTGSVTVTYPSGSQQLILSGTAVGAVVNLTLSPTSFTFATTDVGDVTLSQAAVLANKGSASVALSSIAASDDFLQTNNCPASLPASSSCTVYIQFAPLSAGAKTGTVTVTYPSGSVQATLSGTATGGTAGLVTLSPASHTFPNQATGSTSSPVTVTLTNGQTTTLTISSIQIAAPFLQTNNCGASLAAGASCSINVTYKPTVGGTHSANLIVTDDVVDSPQTAAFAGSSGQPGVSTIPAAGGLYFYNTIVLTKSSPLPVTVTNNQAIPLHITGLTSNADFPFTTDCVDSSGTGTLAPNTSCVIEVTFYPQVLGKRTGSLTITHDAKNSPIVIPLVGTGIADQPGLRITLGPPAPCSLPSQSQQFTATVTGSTNTAVNWYVNNILNGNSSVGTITTDGLYTAPAALGSYAIKAVSVASPGVYGLVTIDVTNTPSFTVYPYSSSIPVNTQQTFQPQLCAAPDAGAVTWTVDNIPGGNSTVGTVSDAGVYTAPAVAGKHTVRVTETALNKTTGAVVTVFSSIAVDFGSRTTTAYPVPPELFGTGRGESIQTVGDRKLLTQAGLTMSRLSAQLSLVYATQTPDWTKIDPYIASIQAAGQTAMLQLVTTPPWLLPNPNPCGQGSNVAMPTDPVKWGQIAASYVAHMDTNFPGVVTDYEIWNEPNASGLCGPDHKGYYVTLYAASAPLMKAQAAADGATIHVGGPGTAGFQPDWTTALLTDPTTKDSIDFVSYHQYMFDQSNLQVQWDTYNGNVSMYQQVQDSGASAQAVYKKAAATVTAAGATTPIYVTEYNTNWAFYKDCCRNDPAYAPVWNALYVTDLLDTAYLGLTAPGKLIYFAGSAYPWICMIGVLDPNLDCLYSQNGTMQGYPQYYTYQLLSSYQYLGLVAGGHMAKTVSPPVGGGGLAVTAFYTASKDSILITNPTAEHYAQIQINLQNVGYGTPSATLYQIVNGALINSSSLALTQQGSTYTTTIDIPPYSVQGIAVIGP
jgi:hypothetical protein